MPRFGQLPRVLVAQSSTHVLGEGVPAFVVRPEEKLSHEQPAPVLIWMHGRTAHKELDPGRFLRLMRAGIGCVSLDLPGHGARHDEDLHDPAAVLRIVEQMASEVDGAVESMLALGGFDPARIAIGGISAGGMAALVRTTSEHSFCAMTLESTTGDLRNRRSTKFADPARLERLNPITHLDNWRDVPLLALHNRLDEWVDVDGQLGFLDALRTRAKSPTAIEHHVYEKPTGAPFEHAGFGRFSADAKDRQVSFLTRIFFESNPR